MFPSTYFYAHLKMSCDFALWDGITWLTSGPLSFTASVSCSGRSEIPEESLSSTYFCIIVLHDCVPKQPASTSERSDSIYCVTSAHSEVQVICHIWKILYSVASTIFLVIFSTKKWRFCSLWLVAWKRCFIRICFMRYSSFAHKLNLNLWMET